ncbi:MULTISPECIES: TetR family transcriptional regulator [unclassified Streptomyces]|uniref:TetR family transcriptional regulator n=1 Tax=Streptomyces johnsoniae TaxID=3075532 RepID=A0ABU2S094_9ACTN|nr:MULTISPECIES: TetR family transcriptional regulator [unclassified Streptomyces]MDT0442423.1 TetR family transcriptional regulator [Streptomyces sp. DSM 41886]ONK10236.1 transcriptional repressor BetI [Streptomyces sp. MP131-18]
MGHRERLMAGAKRCLEERGYARTTSRDLAAAANAPLGAINYHYGSKEALLNAALLEAVFEWGERAMPAAAGPGEDSDRIEALWSRIIASMKDERPLLVATTEAFAQAERAPEIRQQIADAMERARPRLAAQLHGEEMADDEETARAVGSVHMALVAGLTQQMLVDPERTPGSRELAIGLRAIARSLEA